MVSAGPKLTTGSFTITATVTWQCPICGNGSSSGSVTIDVVGDDDGGEGGGCGGTCGATPALGTASFGKDGADFRLALGAANRDANQQVPRPPAICC